MFEHLPQVGRVCGSVYFEFGDGCTEDLDGFQEIEQVVLVGDGGDGLVDDVRVGEHGLILGELLLGGAFEEKLGE